MRTTDRTSAFKRDFRKTQAIPRYRKIEEALHPILQLLRTDQPLPPEYRDHPLKGAWSGYRECHLYPDRLLVYQKRENLLVLHRLGSHSELFG